MNERMNEYEVKNNEFSIDNVESLSIRNNWCAWCVNVYVSDQTGDWKSCGAGILSFHGRKKYQNMSMKLSSVKELKLEGSPFDNTAWEAGMFTLQVRVRKNLAPNNKNVQIDNEIKKKLSMNGPDDLILHCELQKSTQCALSGMVILWYQEDINEHLAISFLSAVTLIESWEIICQITGCDLQDTFKIELEYIDKILESLETIDDDQTKKKLTIAVFCSKMDSVKDLMKMYKSLSKDSLKDEEYARKIQRITMILLESSQMDIIIHILNDEVFYDLLEMLSDMHSDRIKGRMNYMTYFRDHTKFINYYNFEQKMVDSIRLRYKIMFLKDYVFCDHPKEEFYSYLESIIAIPNASIFLALVECMTEQESVFLHLLNHNDEKSNQFFYEFFSIYKPLAVRNHNLQKDSKSLFCFSFYTRKFYINYIKKVYEYLQADSQDAKDTILNLFEMIYIVIEMKKEYAMKIMGSVIEPSDNISEKITFSMVLNLMLLDKDEKIRDCYINLISMTESVALAEDKKYYIPILNSYLLPEMANHINKCDKNPQYPYPPAHYFTNFMKLIVLCIDKDKTSNNNMLLCTNILTYNILISLSTSIVRYGKIKSFTISYLQMLEHILNLEDDRVLEQVLENNCIDHIWMIYEGSLKKMNIIYSICMKILSDIANFQHYIYIEHICTKFHDSIMRLNLKTNKTIDTILKIYDLKHSNKTTVSVLNNNNQYSNSIDGQFSDMSNADNTNINENSDNFINDIDKHEVIELNQDNMKSSTIHQNIDEILSDNSNDHGLTTKTNPETSRSDHFNTHGESIHIGKREPLNSDIIDNKYIN